MIQIAEDLTPFLQAEGKEPADAARELIILELFREGRISRGRAADLLNWSLPQFAQRLSQLGIAWFDMSDEEFATESEVVAELSRADRL